MAVKFDTSIQNLWDAFSEGKVTDSYHVEMVEPEYDQLNDLFSIKSGTLGVLETNGIDTPAELKSAEDSEIIGSVTYTVEVLGEEKERTAEIEAGDGGLAVELRLRATKSIITA